MRWYNGETYESKKRRLKEWHIWFAWYPVVIGTANVNGKTRRIKAWLEYVERSRGMHSTWDGIVTGKQIGRAHV